MVHDNITYAVIAASLADWTWKWTAMLPEPSLQNTVYVLTAVWLIVQIYFKLKGR